MRKTILVIALALGALANSVQADFSVDFNSGFQNGGSIPDGSFIGLADTRTLTTVPFNTIQDVNVRLNISGNWNGDLYAYLVHNSGFAVLLNRVGRSASSSFGYSDAGMYVTFDTEAGQLNDIHHYRSEPGFVLSQIQGANNLWKPDGRNINPLSSGATFDSTVPSALLTSFNGINPNGSWTFFLADVSGGAANTLTSWGLDIQGYVAAVPEPPSAIEGSIAAL